MRTYIAIPRVFITLFLLASVQAQDLLEGRNPIFTRQDLSLGGRLRDLTLADVLPSPGSEAVVLTRTGAYPKWNADLTVFAAAGKKLKPAFSLPIPSDTIFYSFIPVAKGSKALALLRPKALEVHAPDAEGSWEHPTVKTYKLDRGFDVFQPGAPQPASFSVDEKDPRIFVPVQDGLAVFDASGKELRESARLPARPRAYFFSSTEAMPLEIPFWLRGTMWFPKIVAGSLDGKAPALLFPWMDEVEVVDAAGKSKVTYFHKVSDAEREDGQSQVVMTAVDLNHDGRVDFLLNKFKGAATSLTAETTVHLTGINGEIDVTGQKMRPEGNRAAGAIAVDLDRDGKMELGLASSQFNAWAIARALTQGQVKVNFAFYFNHPQGYRLDRADFTREILFAFDLRDLDIDGILPTLEGDFNGDGYPDVFYAKNRRAVTVLLQNPNSPERFPAVPSGEYDVAVTRKVRVGDLDGDGRADVVLYDRRSSANRKFTVLLSTKVLGS